jgi:hypothetical protein
MGVVKENNHVDLVVGDASANLLAAAVGVGEEQLDGKSGRLGHLEASSVGGAHGMLGKNTTVGNAELHHQFFLVVMTHERYVHRKFILSERDR